MASQVIWRTGNPLLVDIPAPIDRSDPSVPLVVDAATCTGHLFDKKVQSEATAPRDGAGLAYMQIRAEDVELFEIGDKIEITQFGQIRDRSTVASVDTTQNRVNFTPALAIGWNVGARIIKQIGLDITGAAYGSPSIATRNWGYTIEFPYDHSDTSSQEAMNELQALLVEAVLHKAATGAHWERSWNVVRGQARPRV